MADCITPDKQHNYRATEANADYSPDGVLFSVGGRVTCSFCGDSPRVYELTEAQLYPVNRELASLHVGKFTPGHPDRISTEPRPMSESYALFALEAYGVDVTGSLPYGLGPVIPGAGMFEAHAPGDMWITVTTAGRIDEHAGRVYTVTVGQLARIPKDPRLAADL